MRRWTFLQIVKITTPLNVIHTTNSITTKMAFHFSVTTMFGDFQNEFWPSAQFLFACLNAFQSLSNSAWLFLALLRTLSVAFISCRNLTLNHFGWALHFTLSVLFQRKVLINNAIDYFVPGLNYIIRILEQNCAVPGSLMQRWNKCYLLRTFYFAVSYCGVSIIIVLRENEFPVSNDWKVIRHPRRHSPRIVKALRVTAPNEDRAGLNFCHRPGNSI